MKLGEAVYGANKGGTEEAPSGEAQAGAKSSDNVVDADFEEVKDDKKKSA